MMLDVTPLFVAFRETTRHLWNSAFYRPDADRDGMAWDRRDAFSRVATELFSAIVLEPLGVNEQRLPRMSEAHPAAMTCVEVEPTSVTGVPIMINRASPRTGYWDDPVRQIAPGEVRMQFVQFFDWDQIGARDFQYAETLIVDFPAHPELVGRHALIEFGYARFRFIESAAA